MNHRPSARPVLVRYAGGLLLLTLLVPVASAHAVLQSAEPSPNGHADAGLTTIELRFTEDVEHEYTTADVVDLQGASWANGPVEFDAAQGSVIRLPTRPLESGIYALNWKALSVDTHTTRGSFVFAVGNATLKPNQYQAEPSDPGDHDFASVARDGFARFAFYAGLFLVVGMPFFALFVERAPDPPRSMFATAASFGFVGAAGGVTGLFLLAERTGLGSGVFDTSPGRSLLWRSALLALASGATWIAFLRPALWRSASWAAIALGSAAMLATSLGSHAAAVREDTWLYEAADFAHLAMAAVWIGGVAAFIHACARRGGADLSAMVLRFSPIGIASVLLLLATGTLASVAHIPCVRGLDCTLADAREPYVQLVALKLSLMAPLVALGAYHKFRAEPRLAQGATGPNAFRRVLVVEALTMTIVLVAAGVLAASAPPQGEVEQGTPIVSPIFEAQKLTEKSHVILQIDPNPVTVGEQHVVIAVHPLGPRLPNGTQVAIKVWPANEAEPELLTVLEKTSPDEWEIRDGLFTSAGNWTLQVILQRPDEFVKIDFAVPVVNPGQA